jgi:hypothetical protein
MSKLNIETENNKLSVTVRESDEYTQLVQVKFDKHVIPENIETCYVSYSASA